MPVAIGTQTLGSVIRPAAFCGVVGYKPSFGAISRTGIHPFSATLDTVGVFARSVADAAWFGACLMGTDARDEATAVRGAQHALRVPLEPLAAVAAPRGGAHAQVVARDRSAAREFRRVRRHARSDAGAPVTRGAAAEAPSTTRGTT